MLAFPTELIPFLLVFLVLPISLGIILLSWIIGKFSSRKLAHSVRKYLFILLGIGFFTIVIWDYVENLHIMKFELASTYEIQVNMQEIDSFLDWPVDVEAIILDKESGEKLEVEFRSEGPYFQFLLHPDRKIWMKGYDESQLIDWTFDFEKLEVYEDAPREEDEFIFHKQINMQFEVEEDLAKENLNESLK